MKIYGLAGKSGTGKSFQALNLCRERKIECIIDDGLFIGKNKIYAGKSAKREATRVGAIKTALFTDPSHRAAVIESIKNKNPKSILVLGTSEKMVRLIIERLQLPQPSEIIFIEDITNEREREIARRQRKEMGKHIIPVPTFQLKREFSGYFLDPLRIFRDAGSDRQSKHEKSVVRPTFSYLGDYVILEKAIHDIIVFASKKVPGTHNLTKIKVINHTDGIELHMEAVLRYGCNIKETAVKLQKQIEEEVENMTAFNIISVNITVKGLV